jgi:hypothetical protein
MERSPQQDSASTFMLEIGQPRRASARETGLT